MFKNSIIIEGFFKLSIHMCAIYFIFTLLILYFKENCSGLIYRHFIILSQILVKSVKKSCTFKHINKEEKSP